MEKFNELIDVPAELIGSPNPAWDDTPEEPIALAYSPDPVEERVFITEAYAHDLVKFATVVNTWMEQGHVENARNASPAVLLHGNPRCFLSIDTTLDAIKEVVRVSREILARGEE
jgi:hypothetical protein